MGILKLYVTGFTAELARCRTLPVSITGAEIQTGQKSPSVYKIRPGSQQTSDNPMTSNNVWESFLFLSK